MNMIAMPDLSDVPAWAEPVEANEPSRGTWSLSEVVVGETRYPLREDFWPSLVPDRDSGEWLLLPDPACPERRWPAFGGRGPTPAAAFDAWRFQLHTRFQTLRGKRDWEKSPAELRETAEFERLIDMEAYERDTPFRYRATGVIRRRPGQADVIRWGDDDEESVTLDQVPWSFTRYADGQRFEAIVERKSFTCVLIRVLYVAPLKPLPDEVPEGFWESLGSSRDAPKVEWSEI